MVIQQIDPQCAHELMQAGHTYIDVRTVEEFAAAHPTGAVNVPVFVPDARGQMTPNAEFLPVIQAIFAPDAPLVLGCRTGTRSQLACEMLAQVGYVQLANVLGTFGQVRGSFGHSAASGWIELGLPVSQGNGAGTSYESLRARALGKPAEGGPAGA